jgi:MOSC domain-containing protein YiiM
MDDADAACAGHVEGLFTAPADGEPMEPRESVEAVEGGLRGDRYLLGTGHYVPYDVCEVTIVAGEALDEIREAYGIDLSDGRHRRNVVTRGVDVHALLETTFRVGDATFRGTRPRPPCAHVERVAGEEGVARALKEGRGGVCADVVSPGRVSVGDDVAVVEASPRDVGAAIAARLDERAREREGE